MVNNECWVKWIQQVITIKSMKKPKWQKRFKDLPEIPFSKQWEKGYTYTLEQRISNKLIQGEAISNKEELIMGGLVSYYQELFSELQKLDYSKFSKSDIFEFKNYIFYAFNYEVLFTNDVTIFKVFRVVINENVVGSKDSIEKKGFLTYPPLHIIKKRGRYNRANTKHTTVFYGSETIDTALNELRPKKGDVVTVGIWEPTRKGSFISYPISHSKEALGVNENVRSAMRAFIEFKKTHPKPLVSFMEAYFVLVGSEFSKQITHHFEYMISSMLSERIFDNTNRKGTPWDIEMILYPSVGNRYKTINFAIRRDVFRHNFELSKVIEFEVTNTLYDSEMSADPEGISLVEFKNKRNTKHIEDNKIYWDNE